MESPFTTSAREARKQEAARKKFQLHPNLDYEDFHAYLPARQYIYIYTRELWTAVSVDSCLPPRVLVDANNVVVLNDNNQPLTLKASQWLDKKRPVEQMTWIPGKPMIIRDRLVSDGGWVPKKGASCFNLYRPPLVLAGDAALAAPWVEHVQRLYPNEAEHLFAWMAQRVQRPYEKINHAIVLGGAQGIGKDSILEPLKHAVGPWNFTEVSPIHVMGRFNGYVKSTILRISEAHDLGDMDRYGFYDRTKILTAAPPDVLRVDEKNLREHSVFNVTGVIITTNHKTDGIYLPPDDRRHFVAWSELELSDIDEDYFAHLFGWYRDGGLGHVVRWLQGYDLSSFDAKAAPPKTDAWRDIVDANRAVEHSDFADALDAISRPDAITISDLISALTPVVFKDWLLDKKSHRVIPHRLNSEGYTPTRNPTANDGLWSINSRRQMIYCLKSFSKQQRDEAARLRAQSV